MPEVMSELDRDLSVQSGWNVSALCFNAHHRSSARHATLILPVILNSPYKPFLLSSYDCSHMSPNGGRHGSGVFDAEGWQHASSEFLAPGIGTTMMASFWQAGKAANMQHHGCWNITLSAINRDRDRDRDAHQMGNPHSSASAQCTGASEAQEGMHCDLEESRALAALKLDNYSTCLAACCANVPAPLSVSLCLALSLQSPHKKRVCRSSRSVTVGRGRQMSAARGLSA